jgi:hypothetical protein
LDDRAAAMVQHPTCRRCGSTRLRRAHSRSRLQKLLRNSTDWDRYACGACGHRGWSRGKKPVRDQGRRERAALAPGAARPMERRDHRLRRRVKVRTFLAVAASLLLGIVAALYLQQCGGAPPVE